MPGVAKGPQGTPRPTVATGARTRLEGLPGGLRTASLRAVSGGFCCPKPPVCGTCSRPQEANRNGSSDNRRAAGARGTWGRSSPLQQPTACEEAAQKTGAGRHWEGSSLHPSGQTDRTQTELGQDRRGRGPFLVGGWCGHPRGGISSLRSPQPSLVWDTEGAQNNLVVPRLAAPT